MLRDLGHEVSARGVAKLYRDYIDVFVLDEVDASTEPDIRELEIRAVVTNTVMNTLEDKQQLARRVLEEILNG